MNEPIHRESRLSVLEATGLILLFLTVGVWGAAITAMAIMAAAQHVGGAIGFYLVEAGADRVMRRCLMGWAALFILVLLRRGGWRGWRDCGFSIPLKTPELAPREVTRPTENSPFVPPEADPPLAGRPGDPTGRVFQWNRFSTHAPEALTRPWWGQVFIGISVGLISLGSLSLLTLLLDLRVVTPVATTSEGVWRAVVFIGSGITVALIEETICRGMLFRVLARSWSVWPAAVLTSMLFALAHFLSPDPQAFQGPSFLRTSIGVFASTYATAIRTPAGLLVFLNLTLLGIVFCGFVVRTRALWLGIGAHAAWVWVVKFFHLWTEVAPNVRPTLWLGTRSDFMDSIAVSALMAVLIAWAFGRSRWAGSVLRHQGLRWRVVPAERESLLEWLSRYYGAGVLKEGVVLKDDCGCRVMAQAGRILKSYWPKQGWVGIRFAFRPSRAKRAFLLGQKLLALGIPTPMPLAWTVRRRFGLLRAETIIIAEAVGTEPLTDWLARNIRDPAARARVMAAYGRLTAMFHQAGYSNRDLKHENVMCSPREPWKLQVIDLDGVRHSRWIFRRRAGRDLRRVGKSLAALGWSGAAEVRAFFDAYNAGVPPRLSRHAFPL